MFNMRIDVIRKELEYRFQKVTELKDSQSPEVADKISAFVYFLLSTEGVNQFVLDIANFEKRFKAKNEYKEIKKGSIAEINRIVTIATVAGFEKYDILKTAIELDSGLSNISYLRDDHGDVIDCLSVEPFFKYLREFNNYYDNDYSELETIVSLLNTIFEAANKQRIDFDSSNYKDSLGKLSRFVITLKSHLEVRAEYEFAPSAARLIAVFKQSNFRPLVVLNDNEYGRATNEKEHQQRIGDSRPWKHFDIEDCKNLYHAVDKYLLTGKSKSVLIDRLKTYCMWIRRKDFPKTKARTKYKNEKAISNIIQEFIFNSGYFPIVDFSAGTSKPDILAMPDTNLSWDNSVLIELKQYIGKSYSSKQFQLDVGQAREYLSIVKGVKPDIADSVYLLVFYSGDKRFVLDEVFSDNNVCIEFIYVGEKTPSKLKDDIIYGSK